MPFLLLFLIQTLAPTWDTPQLFTAIISANVKLQPVLKQIHPNEWKGAPASYQSQWESAVKANQALQTHAAAVSKAPENLGESLRQYQNPELADLLDGMLAEGKAARDAYSQRVLDLAAQREEQFDVADHEAQRCRAQLSSQPNKQTKR